MTKILNNYKKECPSYAESYSEATKYLKRRQNSYKYPTNISDIHLDYENDLLKRQLLIAESCPLNSTKKIILETAIRIIPFSGVSAEVREYKPNKYFAILYNGTIDFFGGISAVLFAFQDELEKKHNYDLSIQKLLDTFFGLALIYYDFGLDSGTYDARHSIFYDLRKEKRPLAGYLTTVASQFLISHEIGHIVDRNDLLNKADREFSADFFAFTALREAAFKLNNEAEIELSILGCVLVLATLQFIEETFPGIDIFPLPTLDYPSAKERLENILSKFPNNLLIQLRNRPIYKNALFLYEKMSELIKGGARPSYW